MFICIHYYIYNKNNLITGENILSIGYEGIAHLQDYDYSEKIAIYSFDCIRHGFIDTNTSLHEDGLFTVTYEISEDTFTSNKGKVKNIIKCLSKLEVDKFSSNCIQSNAKGLVKRFQMQFNNYMENNNGMIPVKLSFVS